MSQTRKAAPGDPGGARSVEERHVVGPNAEDEIDPVDDRGRRWYHLRPEPRRRTDFMGFNSTWWMSVVWLIVIVLVVSPFPWW
jgi:hypothetical protein